MDKVRTSIQIKFDKYLMEEIITSTHSQDDSNVGISTYPNLQPKHDPSKIAIKINQKVVRCMKRSKCFIKVLRKIAPEFVQKSSQKLSDQLFILKLHCYLKESKNHLKDYCALTEEAQKFINETICKFDVIFSDNWQNHPLYISKFLAFRKLLSYLRQNSWPTKEKLDQIIKTGIYGIIKGKNNSKHANIDEYISEYDEYFNKMNSNQNIQAELPSPYREL